MKLTCAAKECLHNKKGACTSGMIQVVNARSAHLSNYCATYTKDEGTYLLTADRFSNPLEQLGIFDSEFAEEFNWKNRSNADSPAIVCNLTKCRFNYSRSCKADDVFISEPKPYSLQHPCRTYQPG